MARDREGETVRRRGRFRVFPLVRHPTTANVLAKTSWPPLAKRQGEEEEEKVSSAFFPAVCRLLYPPLLKANL